MTQRTDIVYTEVDAQDEAQLSNYERYRGKCLEMSEELCRQDSTLRLIRGYYHCPIWGKQAHWWTARPNGGIVDPTVLQFPSAGLGLYEEFNGMYECEYCSEPVHEDDAYMVDHHVYCSGGCYARDVGF